MKKMVRFVCTFLAFVVFLAVPVSALVTSEERASNYFSTHTLYLEKTSGNGINIWFDVTGVDEMDELGASSIIMQRSVDKDTWEDMKTYTKSVYPQMIEKKLDTIVAALSTLVLLDITTELTLHFMQKKELGLRHIEHIHQT